MVDTFCEIGRGGASYYRAIYKCVSSKSYSLRGVPGCGIVLAKACTVLKWPAYVNSNKICICGPKFRHKLTFLELIGYLLHVTVFAELVVDHPVVTNKDNEGTVCVSRNVRDMRCPLTD